MQKRQPAYCILICIRNMISFVFVEILKSKIIINFIIRFRQVYIINSNKVTFTDQITIFSLKIL